MVDLEALEATTEYRAGGGCSLKYLDACDVLAELRALRAERDTKCPTVQCPRCLMGFCNCDGTATGMLLCPACVATDALRAERDGLAEQCELLKSMSQQQLDLARADRLEAWKERDALRARVAELTAERDRWKLADRDKLIRVAELERLGAISKRLRDEFYHCLCEHCGPLPITDEWDEVWRKAVRG